jgi:hypothetical protein
MNKQQLKQFAMIQAHAMTGNLDAAARGLSAMYRCAMTNKSKAAILAAATQLNIRNNADFIV